MTCNCCASVIAPSDPDQELFLYCVLPDGHPGSHYDDGANLTWHMGPPS